MRLKNIQAIFIFVLMASVLGIAIPEYAKAASAAIGFTADKSEVLIGETIRVYLTIDADATIGDFEGNIRYNSDVLQFTEGASCVSGGEGILRFADFYASASDTTRRYLLKFVAIAPGTSNIEVSNQPMVFEYETGLAMPVSSTNIVITVNADAEASDDASLSELKVNPGTLTPTFNTNIYEYNITVGFDVEKLIVSAEPNDSNSIITLIGNTSLALGNNEVLVLVTAETGRIQEYKLLVYREEKAATPTPTVTPTPTEAPAAVPDDIKDFEWKLETSTENGSIFITGSFKFEVCSLPDTITIPSGYSKTKLIIDGTTITAYAPSSNALSDFLLLVLKREDGEIGLYRYDRAEKTIQRFLTEDIKLVRDESSYENSNSTLSEEYEANVTRMGFIIAILAAVAIVTTLGLIKFYLKARGVDGDGLD